jgi:hypothetical protein
MLLDGPLPSSVNSKTGGINNDVTRPAFGEREIGTVSAPCRRQTVLEFGTGRSSLIRLSTEDTNP